MKKGSTLSTALDEYTIVERINGGGAGTVYRAIAARGEEYAVKILNTKQGQSKHRRFQNELNYCLSAQNDGIVRVLDHGLISDGSDCTPFYVMRLYSGSLRDKMKEGIEVARALEYFRQILEAIASAHADGVVHRDLKPENVLYDAGADRMIVADFGIARFLSDELSRNVETKLGERLANFQYAAPEQRRVGGDCDHRTDIFSLGLILAEMLTGEVPQGTSPQKIADHHADLGHLDELVDQMTRQSIDERPGSILEVCEMMGFAVDVPGPAQGAGKVPSSDRSEKAFVRALQSAVQRDDLVGWRAITEPQVAAVQPAILEHRERLQLAAPADTTGWHAAVHDLLEDISPAILAALIAMDSKNPEFSTAEDLIFTILHEAEPVAGTAGAVGLPDAVVYAVHSLLGAYAIKRKRPRVAVELARLKVHPTGRPAYAELWTHHRLMGWSQTLGGSCDAAWHFLVHDKSRWDWCAGFFGSTDQIVSCIGAYFLALSILEFGFRLSAEPDSLDANRPFDVSVPFTYFRLQPNQATTALASLAKSRAFLEQIAAETGVAPDDIRSAWPKWMGHAHLWLRSARLYFDIDHLPFYRAMDAL